MVDQTGTNQPIGSVLSPRQESFLIDCITTAVAVTIGRAVTCNGFAQSGLAFKPQVIQNTAVVGPTTNPVLGVATQTTGAVVSALQVCARGLVICEAGGAIAIGSPVESDTSGRATNQFTNLTGLANGATAVTADAASPTVLYFTAFGILIVSKNTGAQVAGDGVGVLVRT